MAGRKSIDGFEFYDVADISIADNEIKRINYITNKMNMDNPKGVLAVYDKLISSGIFVTPIGYEYLRGLQDYLYKCSEISDDDIRDIPIAISYTSAMNMRNRNREERKEEKAEEERAGKNFIKTFRTEYKISIIINLVLIIAVIAMFVITLKADNPNMINYRTAIVNQYSEWQQELEQREEAVRAKERELNMSEFTE